MNKLDEDKPLMRFELAELETFLVVLEEGSFSLAAKRLHVSQPSVTTRVKRLEDTLRVKLLIRTTRRVEPTAEGAELAVAAEEALKGLRSVLKRFQVSAEVERNEVKVVATPMLAATVLPRLIHSYCERYPDVQVQLRDLPYDRVISDIADGSADIGIAALDGVQNRIRFQLLAEEEMLLVVPARHALAEYESVTLDQITPYPLMFLGRYSSLRDRLGKEYEERGAAFKPRTAATLPMLLGMIDAGNCITFLPRSMAQNNARQTRKTIAVKDFATSRCYGSVLALKAELHSAALSFHRHLRQEFESTLHAEAEA